MNRFFLAMVVACLIGCATTVSPQPSQSSYQRPMPLPQTATFTPKGRMRIVQEALPSVALVVFLSENGEYRGQATGFHIAPGMVLTSAHATQDWPRYAVAFGDYVLRPCRPLQVQPPSADMLVMEIDRHHRANLPPVLPVRRTSALLAEDIVVIGFQNRPFIGPIPGDLRGLAPPIVTQGIVAGVNIDIGVATTTFTQIDATLAVGNSGSPVLGMDGQVIGMVKGFSSENASQGFAVNNERILASLSSSSR